MHLVMFVAPTFHFKDLKNDFLWLLMFILPWTGPKNGSRTLAPNTSKMINKKKENWLSGAADRARQIGRDRSGSVMAFILEPETIVWNGTSSNLGNPFGNLIELTVF